jgi:hypothetical protein
MSSAPSGLFRRRARGIRGQKRCQQSAGGSAQLGDEWRELAMNGEMVCVRSSVLRRRALSYALPEQLTELSPMRTLFTLLVIAAAVQSLPGLAKPPAASPLFGAWSVDTSRLPIPPEARPKSVTITFSDAGGGKVTTDVDIVDAGGAESHVVGTTELDGTPTYVTGSNEADTSATKMPQSNVLVMALAKNGMPASTRIYAVSADGTSLIETAVYFDHSGSPIMRTNYFSRLH